MADDAQDRLEQLDKLLADQEREVRDAFRGFIASVGSAAVADQIIAKLGARDIEGAMAIIDSYVARMADVIPRISATVGRAAADELADVLAEAVPDMATAVGFDPSHARAAELVREQRLAFVRDFSDKQRASVQQVLNRALNEGLHPMDAARRFRSAIGLTAYQENIVNNFRQSLENRDRKALQYELRDRRSDGVITRAIANDRPIPPAQIESMVDRYRRNFLAMRSETIARTESLQAFSEARDEAVTQMAEQTGLSDDEIIERWNATRDTHTRDWHRKMDGQERKRGEPFVDGLGNKLDRPGDPKAPAATRINCRCTKTYSIRIAS